MRRKRTMALCLAAVFAITAAYAASASAAETVPLFYTNKTTCTGKFGPLSELGQCEKTNLKAQAISFTETGGVALLKGGLKITCQSNSGKGSISNVGGRAHFSKLKITYKECVKTGTSTPCQKTFTTLGVIATEGISGDAVEGSATKGGTLLIVENLTGEKGETKGFTTFYCGKEKTGSIKVNVKGHILIEPKPVLATPDETKLSTEGETANNQQAGIAGCTEAEGFSQGLLFVKGEGTCQFLKVTENGTELEPSVNFGTNTVKYGTKKVELVGS